MRVAINRTTTIFNLNRFSHTSSIYRSHCINPCHESLVMQNSKIKIKSVNNDGNCSVDASWIASLLYML